MARRINLTQEDIEQMESELANKRSKLSNDRVQFLDYLVSRAKAGQKSADRSAVAWEWSYDFYAAPATQ